MSREMNNKEASMSRQIQKVTADRYQDTARNWQIVLTVSALIGSLGFVTHYL